MLNIFSRKIKYTIALASIVSTGFSYSAEIDPKVSIAQPTPKKERRKGSKKLKLRYRAGNRSKLLKKQRTSNRPLQKVNKQPHTIVKAAWFFGVCFFLGLGFVGYDYQYKVYFFKSVIQSQAHKQVNNNISNSSTKSKSATKSPSNSAPEPPPKSATKSPPKPAPEPPPKPATKSPPKSLSPPPKEEYKDTKVNIKADKNNLFNTLTYKPEIITDNRLKLKLTFDPQEKEKLEKNDKEINKYIYHFETSEKSNLQLDIENKDIAVAKSGVIQEEILLGTYDVNGKNVIQDSTKELILDLDMKIKKETEEIQTIPLKISIDKITEHLECTLCNSTLQDKIDEAYTENKNTFEYVQSNCCKNGDKVKKYHYFCKKCVESYCQIKKESYDALDAKKQVGLLSCPCIFVYNHTLQYKSYKLQVSPLSNKST